MSNSNADNESSSSPRLPVDAWLQPLDGSPCGEDLEYDPAFLELTLVAAGKPETQFSAAEPPAWPDVRSQSEALLERTRDLRIGVLWLRSMLASEGLPGLGEGLRLMHGWLDRFWDTLHPALDPDDGDAFARISVLGTLVDLDGALGELRQSLVAKDRRLGGLRVREIEIVLDRLPPREDETTRSRGQIEGMLGDLPDVSAALRAACQECLDNANALQRLMNDRFGPDRAVDLKPLRSMLQAVQSVVPPEAEAVAEGSGSEGDGSGAGTDDDRPAGGRRGGGGAPGSIESRQDAIRAINQICAYLERSEPTNPAQLLLRRAERLINKNFLQAVRDLAPDAVPELARIMGVDPDSISVD